MRGFSLIDLLVAIAVVSVLISIMLPTLASVTESARRVKCASNLRQIGLGLRMWVDANRGRLPYSEFAEVERHFEDPTTMMVLHRGQDNPRNWDGLGRLVQEEYLTAWPIFYCPSHEGNHPNEQYTEAWGSLGPEIVGNYQYRILDTPDLVLARLDRETVIVSDGLRTRLDYNHGDGNNTLRADLSVSWYDDVGGALVQLLPDADHQKHLGFGADGEQGVWTALDTNQPAPDLDDAGAPTGPVARLGVHGSSNLGSEN